MKFPEKAPKFASVSPNDMEKLINIGKSNETLSILRKANDEYLYWDKFKYLSIPENISKKLSWIYLRLMVRDSQIRKIPMQDKGEENFGYWLPDSVLKILHYIDQNAGGNILVDDPRVHASERDRYLVSSIMEEAIASSQLEGAATTREKAKAMLKTGRKPADKAEQMCLNNYITIRNIKKLLDKPLSKKLIIGIQTSITKDTLDKKDAVGRFRKATEEIQVVDDSDGTILFDPPPANEIENRLQNLCEFANRTDDEIFIHPIIKAIILHFWLAYIHPFVDGNGRTARALFYWYMLKNKYWLFEYLSISRILLRAPMQYARAYIYSEIDNQDMTYFLIYNLKAINLAIKSLNNYLSRKQTELKETMKFIQKHPGLNHRQYDILNHAVSHPDATYTIKFQKNIYTIAYQTARVDLLDLKKKGFLEQIKGKGKEFYFIPSKDISKKLRGIK